MTNKLTAVHIYNNAEGRTVVVFKRDIEREYIANAARMKALVPYLEDVTESVTYSYNPFVVIEYHIETDPRLLPYH